jgi:hypothetical protein
MLNMHSARSVLLIVAVAIVVFADAAANKKGGSGGSKKDKEVISKNKGTFNGDKNDPVIGIDLGTTYSCVAVFKEGEIEIVANDLGERTTPSWVAFTDTERLIGQAAKNQVHKNPKNTLYDIKRLIGRGFDDADVQRDVKAFPFSVIDRSGKPYLSVKSQGKTQNLSPEEVSAMILTRMKGLRWCFGFFCSFARPPLLWSSAHFIDVCVISLLNCERLHSPQTLLKNTSAKPSSVPSSLSRLTSQKRSASPRRMPGASRVWTSCASSTNRQRQRLLMASTKLAKCRMCWCSTWAVVRSMCRC